MSQFQKEQDLDDIYSDLSDKDQDNQPPKQSAPILQSQPAPKGNIIRMPAFFGGKAFIPPPPPPSSRPPAKVQSSDEGIPVGNQNSNFHYGNQGQRERRNIIYLKNLPKTYNRQQTLTTFFRTYGNIKSIKTNQQNNSAFVRFQKEQDAYKFMNLKPVILNRSYIVYETSQDFVVLPEKIAEREKEENAALIVCSQKQLMALKESSESLLADKYRALLFLRKNKDRCRDESIEQLNREISKCHRIKQLQGDVQALSEMLSSFQNEYDWTLSYNMITRESVDKKKIIGQLQKYGPISTISVKLANLTGEEIVPQQGQSIQDKRAFIKVKFLGVRSSWEMFLQNHEKLDIAVQGDRLEEIYKVWLADVTRQKQQSIKEAVNEVENKEVEKKEPTVEKAQGSKQEQGECQDVKKEGDENNKQVANEKVIKE